MAFSVGKSSGDDAMVNVNLVPLIDVMLVLLILFIVTIPIQTHSVKLDMPQAGPLPAELPEIVDLEIDFDGTVIWNGTAVPNRATLQSYLETVGDQFDQPEIHLRPSRLARYETVAWVLSDAQRLGVEKIGFVGTSEFTE